MSPALVVGTGSKNISLSQRGSGAPLGLDRVFRTSRSEHHCSEARVAFRDALEEKTSRMVACRHSSCTLSVSGQLPLDHSGLGARKEPEAHTDIPAGNVRRCDPAASGLNAVLTSSFDNSRPIRELELSRVLVR